MFSILVLQYYTIHINKLLEKHMMGGDFLNLQAKKGEDTSNCRIAVSYHWDVQILFL